jgi:putative endonuclease
MSFIAKMTRFCHLCYNKEMEKAFYTYVLRCADDSLYCGYTDDIEQRLASHKAGKGGKYTRAKGPVELLTYVTFPDKALAMKCEWWFKHKLLRSKKIKLIETGTIKSEFEAWMASREK